MWRRLFILLVLVPSLVACASTPRADAPAARSYPIESIDDEPFWLECLASFIVMLAVGGESEGSVELFVCDTNVNTHHDRRAH